MSSNNKIALKVGGFELSIPTEDWPRLRAEGDRQYEGANRYDPSTKEGRENLRHREELQATRAIAAQDAAQREEFLARLRISTLDTSTVAHLLQLSKEEVSNGGN